MNDLMPTKTIDAARILGKSLAVIQWALRTGALRHPKKDSSGHFSWQEDDLAHAREFFERRDRRRRRLCAAVTV